MNSVAIIGAGPSGLIAAKEAKQFGLKPIIFEKRNSLGGVWSADKGLAWAQMSTNLSKYSCSFSDFPWAEHAPVFPVKEQVCEYLEGFVEHNGLAECIRYRNEVISTEFINEIWQVTSKASDGDVMVENFDFAIFSSGFFSSLYTPQIPGLASFKGKVTHSADYDDNSLFEDEHVLVIGNSFSGVEIAGKISNVAERVIHQVSRPIWIIPREFGNDGGVEKAIDLKFYSRKAEYLSSQVSVEEVNKRKNDFFEAQFGNPGNIHPALSVDADNAIPPYVAISDSCYLNNVNIGKVIPQKAAVSKILENSVVFSDGTVETVDHIVFCTGYRLALDYMSVEQLKSLDFDQEDWFQPVLLHWETFHPDFKNAAFVGMYRGPYFGVMELQARWAIHVFASKLEHPSREEMEEGVAEAKKNRNCLPRPQFPHGDYVSFADGIAKKIGVYPTLEYNKDIADELWEGPLLPAHYRLQGLNPSPEIAKKVIKEVSKLMSEDKV